MLHEQQRKADRLSAISSAVSFVLWQIQKLEVSSAQFYVMVALAQPGMGLDAGLAMVRDAQGKTFGATVNKLLRGNHFPPALGARFKALLDARNWLVHKSRETSHAAVFHDRACAELVGRVEQIGNEAGELMRELETLSLAFARRNGLSGERISELTAKTLAEWQEGD